MIEGDYINIKPKYVCLLLKNEKKLFIIGSLDLDLNLSFFDIFPSFSFGSQNKK